jgi:uncharacterized protein YcbX
MGHVGRVSELWIYPVKSMGGTRLEAAQVEASGLVGDRSWSVVRADGSPVTARQEPRLREVGTGFAGGALTLDVPGSPPGLDPVKASAALSDWLGYDVRLLESASSLVDVAPVHLVSRGSIAVGTEPHGDTCDTDPRANLVLDLDGDGAVERGWLGEQIGLGGVGLEVVRHPKHCLGTYAEVRTAGRLTVGDDVRLDR